MVPKGLENNLVAELECSVVLSTRPGDSLGRLTMAPPVATRVGNFTSGLPVG